MSEPLTDWPTEPWDNYLVRVTAEMHLLRTKAIGLAWFYLEHGAVGKAQTTLADCRAVTRAMGTEICDRQMIEAARVAGVTWEQVMAALEGWMPCA